MSKLGSELWDYFCILYLLKKHKHACVFSSKEINIDVIKNANRNGQVDNKNVFFYECNKGLDINKNNVICEFYVPIYDSIDEFKKELMKCINNSQITVIPLKLFFRDFLNESKNFLHANMIIYDKNKNTLERFDPRGETEKILNPDKLDNTIKNLFKDVLKIQDFTYVLPVSYSFDVGPQTTEAMYILENGIVFHNQTCTIWSLIYTDVRLTYPDLTHKQIINFLNNDIYKNSENIVEYIKDVIKAIKSMENFKTIKEIENYIDTINFYPDRI
jgi:hypothetical protein